MSRVRLALPLALWHQSGSDRVDDRKFPLRVSLEPDEEVPLCRKGLAASWIQRWMAGRIRRRGKGKRTRTITLRIPSRERLSSSSRLTLLPSPFPFPLYSYLLVDPRFRARRLPARVLTATACRMLYSRS